MRRRHLLHLGAAGAATLGRSGAAAATPGLDVPPLPGAQPALQVPPIAERRLANGLTLLVVPKPSVPLVSLALHVRAGREADGPSAAGLASTTANLLVKGALRGRRKVDASALAREAESLGSPLDVSSGWRVASVAMAVTTPKLTAALSLVADTVRAPLLQADELERLRAQSLDSLKVSLANPDDVSRLAARRFFWGASVYGGSATLASLQRLKLEDVRRLHAQRYGPERAVLVLAGDVDAESAERLATRWLGSWTAARAAAADEALLAPQPARAERALVRMPGSGQSGVVIAAPYAALADADRRIAEVAVALLGGGYSSRLNQEVRIKRGLSYGAGAGGESHPVAGYLTAGAQTQHATAREVAQLMREEMLRIGREEASEAELAARKATLVGSFVRQLETTSGLAGQVASQYFQGRPLADLARYVDDVLAVTPAQVRRWAEGHWRPEALRTVIAGDLAPQADDWVVEASALDLERPLLKAS